jgi:hypothetical protein
MAKRVGLVVVVALLGACDPGGSYRVRGGTRKGRWDLIPATARTSLYAHASWFTTSVHATLAVLHCANRDDAAVTLAPGESCEIEMAFQVHVDRDRLKELTLTQDGVMRGDVAVPIIVTFELD